MSQNKDFPIVLFTYKRLKNLKICVNALKSFNECSNKKLIIYSDGPKNHEDSLKVLDVRKYIKKINGFKDIEYRFSDVNNGLANTFINGITEVLDVYEYALFLEDDNLISPHLFSFIDNYKDAVINHPNVSCISGYSPKMLFNKEKPFFYPGAESWSFFTWRNSWKCFEISNEKLIEKLNRDFWINLINDLMPYKIAVNNSIKNLNDSWSGRWGLSSVLDNKFTLYPPKPLCINIGYEGSGTNSKTFAPIYNRRLTKIYRNNNLPEIPSNVLNTIPIILNNKFGEIIDPYQFKFYGKKLIKKLFL